MPSLPQSLLVRPTFRNPRPLSPVGKSSKEDLALMEDRDREHLNKQDIHSSMGSDKIYPQALRELPDITVRPLSITFEKSQ